MWSRGVGGSVSGRIVASGALMLAGAGLVACGEAPTASGQANDMASPPAKPIKPIVPTPEPKLTRQDLLSAAAGAASMYAEGQPPSGDDVLVGRTFSVKVAFGCEGPALPGSEQPGLADWQWGPDQKTIQLSMQPAEWANSAMIAQTGARDRWEAVEGFWIPRPWLVSERCPAVQGDPLQTPAAAAPQTLGIAAVFDVEGSRVGRREDRAYQYTVRPEDDAPLSPPGSGYRLLVEGRVEAFPSGRAIECRAADPNERPLCVVATRLDRVAFETAGGSVLTEWRTD